MTLVPSAASTTLVPASSLSAERCRKVALGLLRLAQLLEEYDKYDRCWLGTPSSLDSFVRELDDCLESAYDSVSLGLFECTQASTALCAFLDQCGGFIRSVISNIKSYFRFYPTPAEADLSENWVSPSLSSAAVRAAAAAFDRASSKVNDLHNLSSVLWGLAAAVDERNRSDQHVRQIDLPTLDRTTAPSSEVRVAREGPEGGRWLWWNGKRHDVPLGSVYRLIEHMWNHEFAKYDELMDGTVFDASVDSKTLGNKASEASAILRSIGVPWRLSVDSRDRVVTKQHNKPSPKDPRKKG
ncbi:hypothetical protein [Gemmata massiliana]|nr:hypothetical protein [Gemmata massiliana]